MDVLVLVFDLFIKKSVVIFGVCCDCSMSEAILLCVFSPYHYKFFVLHIRRKEAVVNLDGYNWL